MHLLDTDTLTHLHAGHPRVVQGLREASDPVVGTTIVSKIEILRGRFEYLLKADSGADLLKAQALLTQTENLLTAVLVVPFNDLAATHFDRLLQAKGLKKFGRADLLIASISLAQRATLVTRNVRHFRPVPQLRLVNWVD